MVFLGANLDGNGDERFGHGEYWYAGSKFIALIAVPGYTCEFQRKANNKIVENVRIIRAIFGPNSTSFDLSKLSRFLETITER